MAKNTYVVPDNQLSLFDSQTPSMPVFDKSRCEARLINYETAARMVETYHYAHRVPKILVAIGMFVDETLVGVCTYSRIMRNIASSICGKEYADNVMELTRLFIFDTIGFNSESWLIGQSLRFLPDEISILLSYSDTKENHLGIIYQATNWIYTGISKGAIGREYILPDGTIITRRNGHFARDRKTWKTILSFQEIKKMYPDIKKIKSSDKHRYVYFLGSKSQKRKLRKALKWPVLPYPKEKE